MSTVGIPITAENATAVALITRDLLKPFAESEIKIKPAMVKGNRCLALHYIDSRLVMDRLDEVVGIDGWRDEYTVLPSSEVECRLSLKIGGTWITKADVGGQSEQPDEGDRMKAAYSDALKRAAVKFGVGRFLYRLPKQWMDYDPINKQVIRPNGQKPQTPKQLPAPQHAADAKTNPSEPRNGAELRTRLQAYDAKLSGQKLCAPGALLAHVAAAGVKAGYAANMADWSGPAIPFAVDAVKEFEKSVRPKA